MKKKKETQQVLQNLYCFGGLLSERRSSGKGYSSLVCFVSNSMKKKKRNKRQKMKIQIDLVKTKRKTKELANKDELLYQHITKKLRGKLMKKENLYWLCSSRFII
ncbi:hypothetical protein LINPERHAP1_LOCUS37685 [Linum perenne]